MPGGQQQNNKVEEDKQDDRVRRRDPEAAITYKPPNQIAILSYRKGYLTAQMRVSWDGALSRRDENPRHP